MFIASENTAMDYSNNLDEARSGVTSPTNFHVPKAKNDKVSEKGDDDSGNNHAERLDEARKGSEANAEKGKGALNDAKNIAELATPMGTMSLIKYVDFIGDMPYVAAMGVAMLKDLVDLGTFETVILPILFSMLCSIFIFMMMLMVGSGGKRKSATAIFKKIGFLLGGGVADAIPGLGFFPIETMTVILIYALTLVERKNAK